MDPLSAINFSTNGQATLVDYIFKNEDLDLPEQQKQNILSPIKKINIFVGANNSGKSRILRKIFKQEDFGNIEALKWVEKIRKDLPSIQKVESYYTGPLALFDAFIKQVTSVNFWIKSEQDKRTFRDTIEYLEQKGQRIKNNLNGEDSKKLDEIIENIKNINETPPGSSYDKLYIPILRGLRQIGNQEPDQMRGRTVFDYFEERSEKTTYNPSQNYAYEHKENWNKCIFTGHSVFTSIRNKLLGSRMDREFIEEYQNWLKENFFETEEEVTLIPARDSDVIHVTLSSDRPDVPIHQMGDGLQSIFIITYPLFEWTYKNKDNEKILLACIEEPELFLHPSMQNKIIQTLKRKEFNKIQFFITTHSNHFLDVIQEENQNVSIFNVQNKGKQRIVTYATDDLSETIYTLLGAKPSSMLLANKAIWVEGVSDRIYLRKGLELFHKEYPEKKKINEDADFTFIEYGGSNLAHYVNSEEGGKDLEITKISNLKNVFLLADDDGTSDETARKDKRIDAKHKRYEEIKEQIEKGGGKFQVTSWKEIENYITKSVLEKVYKKTLPKDFEAKSREPNKKLGEELRNNGCITYTDDNGDLKKEKFAQKVSNNQETWEELSKEMQKLIEVLYAFITK